MWITTVALECLRTGFDRSSMADGLQTLMRHLCVCII